MLNKYLQELIKHLTWNSEILPVLLWEQILFMYYEIGLHQTQEADTIILWTV